MKRNKKERFTKEDISDDRYEFRISFPSFKFFLYCVSYYNFSSLDHNYFKKQDFRNDISFFENIMTQIEEETSKKNGIFY